MKKIFSLLLTLVVSTSIAFAANINPANIKTDNDYTKYVEDVIFEKTPTAFSYVKRQIKYKITIEKTGKISSYEVIDSSGSEKYDAKVKEAVTSLELPAFPKGTKMSKLTFTYDVEKRVNVKIPVKVPSLKLK